METLEQAVYIEKIIEINKILDSIKNHPAEGPKKCVVCEMEEIICKEIERLGIDA
jgi:hypothetical protein